MPPVVAEIVYVGERRSWFRDHLPKSHSSGIKICLAVLRVGIAVSNTANNELVEMAVVPPHDFLQNKVQLVQRYAARHLKSSPDWWPDVLKRNLKLVNST